MENKKVGLLIIGISLLIIVIILIFNIGLRDVISASCSHGPSCGMYNAVRVQTGISLAIAGFVFLIGLFLVFSKPEERIVVKKIKGRERKKKLDLSRLDNDEKNVVRLLQLENGAMFQRDLMEKLETGKVKITRLLDKLEAEGLVERKRRGMNNIVVLRN